MISVQPCVRVAINRPMIRIDFEWKSKGWEQMGKVVCSTVSQRGEVETRGREEENEAKRSGSTPRRPYIIGTPDGILTIHSIRSLCYSHFF